MSTILLFSSIAHADNENFVTQSVRQIKKGIEDKHPSAYYILAHKLFVKGQKEEAVFWFYTGQIRYRYHLAVHPDLEPSGDPALFSSFTEVIGRPINEFAFGDLPQILEIITKSLEWDQSHSNGFTPKEKDPEQYEEVISGLKSLQSWILEEGDSIRKQRKQKGLENRT
ncbi:MAG: hypothetical protein V5783_05575 [Pontiella sp.]